MRLDEFVNQKVLNELSLPDNFKAAANRLISAGFESLGTGYYGQVFGKPSLDYVLKVFSNRDQAYTDFVKLAQNNPNPHFPKFKGQLVKVTDKYSAVRMEKLIRTTEFDVDSSSLEWYVDSMSQNPKAFEEALADPQVAEQLQPLVELFKKQPKLQEALDLIIDQLIGQYENDLHYENIMSRGNTLVITDPVS